MSTNGGRNKEALKHAASGKATLRSGSKKSQFEKFASTQAAGDGIQGDALKKDKSVDEKIGANMADRK